MIYLRSILAFVGVLMAFSVYDVVYALRRQYAFGYAIFISRWTTPSTLLTALAVATSVFFLSR